MTDEQRLTWITERLTETFQPSALAVEDDSWRHAGHAGARGGGHYTVRIRAEAFAGKRALQRHRLVYAALQQGLDQGEIHALQIEAFAPGDP